MAEIIEWPGITKLDIDPSRVIARAAEADLDDVVVIGFTKDGGFYFASSLAEGGDVLWHLERAKHRLMKLVDEMCDE